MENAEPARRKQHWSKQEISDLMKLHKQFGSDYTSIAIQMKDRGEKAIKSKIQRLFKNENKKKDVLKKEGGVKTKKKSLSTTNMGAGNISGFEEGEDGEDGETLTSEDDEEQENPKKLVFKKPPAKKQKVLHDASWHDITDPNSTTGVPYNVYKGAKHALLFFKVDLLGLKERLKMQIKEGVLSIISAQQTPAISELEDELKIKFSDPEQKTYKIRINLVSRFVIDQRTCKILNFGKEKEYIGVLSEFPSNEAIVFNFEEFQGHRAEDINAN